MSDDASKRSGAGRTNRRRFLTAAGTGVAAGLAGCLGGGGGGGDGPIRFGGVYLLSGIAEALGSASRAAAEVAVNQLNEEGGILGRDVEIIFRDHAGSDANQQFQDLVQQQNVDAMIGLTSSGVTLNSAPTVAQLGVPLTLTDIGTPFITEPDTDTYGDYYNSEDGTAAGQDNIFRTNANTTINTYAMAQYAVEELDVTRVANMGPDYAYGQQTWDYFKAFADALGGDFEYVESVFPELGASDMTPQINQVLSAEPDLVFTSFWAGDAVTFVSQATEQGLFGAVDDVFDTLGADPTVFSALGDTMPEGFHYSSWYWHSAYDNQQNTDFLNAYREEYQDDDSVIDIPSFTGPSTYAAIFLYKEAMEAAGSAAPEDVIPEMEGISYTGPRGEWTIDPDSHQATAPTIIGETSTDDDVPYDGVGLTDTRSVSLTRSDAEELLADSGLPPGV